MKALLPAIAIAASLCIASTMPARAADPEAPKFAPVEAVLDHFACRNIEGEDANRNMRVLGKDQFSGFSVRIARPVLICAPTTKKHGDRDEVPIKHPQAHLVCYTLQDQQVFMPDEKGRNKTIHNQLEPEGGSPISVDVRNLRFFCVPTLKEKR